MTKKINDAKQPKKDNATSKAVGQVNYFLRLGNYAMVRRLAAPLANDASLNDGDRAVVERALRITWPDPLSLLAGFACLVLTTVVAFVVAY